LLANLNQVYNEVGKGSEGLIGLNTKWIEGLNNGIKFADYVTPPYQLYRMPKRFEYSESKLKDWILISGFTMICDHYASFVEGDAKNKSELSQIEIEGINFTEIKQRIAIELKGKIGEQYKESEIWQFNRVNSFKDENTLLLAPTGMGKTEFAYLWSNGDKFFYTLPLRSAVNQIYNRTEKVFGKNNTGILHSDADIYVFGDGSETESMRVYDMARQLAFPAIVSTGDQFFPYALRPPTYEKIFAKFSYSRLIIDEIQAYDPKAAAIAVKFIEHVVQMGGKFLLMTATLPKFIKDELVERIGLRVENELNLYNEEATLQNFTKHRIKIIVDKFSGEPEWSKDIIKQIVAKAQEGDGKRVLVIINTVKHAQFVYDKIRETSKGKIVSSNIKLFHSRYTFFHRKSIEDELWEFMGNSDKSRSIISPKILVATQVVEASLDLDADFVFTELAPWDSLIQRMGRGFRELRNTTQNPEMKISKRYGTQEIPENIFVVVMDGNDKRGIAVFESGKGYIYHRDLLNNTLNLIENREIDETKLQEVSNKGKTPDLNLLSKLDAFALTEPDKNKLVEKLYGCLPNSDKNKSKYLEEYYDMLQVLDAGFMSDRKSEAQKIFREISDVNTIPESIKEKVIAEIEKFDFESEYAYTRFKSCVISRYVVNIQRYKVEEYLNDSFEAAKIVVLESGNIKPKNLNKLKNWLKGIYFVKIDYNETNGLIGIAEEKDFIIF